MIVDFARADLYLQWRPSALPIQKSLPRYRFARTNGWHCGHWHKNVEQAVECVELKLWRP